MFLGPQQKNKDSKNKTDSQNKTDNSNNSNKTDSKNKTNISGGRGKKKGATEGGGKRNVVKKETSEGVGCIYGATRAPRTPPRAMLPALVSNGLALFDPA